MLGKTNTLYVPTGEGGGFNFITETIITETTESIWKMEYANNKLFAFLNDGKVMCGDSADNLSIIQHNGNNLMATHMVYQNGKYYFANAEMPETNNSTSAAQIYETTDLAVFATISIKTNAVTSGMFLDGKGRLVVLVGGYDSSSLLIVDTLDSYEEGAAVFIPLSENTLKYSGLINGRETILAKNRIFYSGSTGWNMIGLDGAVSEANRLNASSKIRFTNDYFYFSRVTTRGLNGPNQKVSYEDLYYSFDGVSVSEIGRSVTQTHIFFEVDGKMGGSIYTDCREEVYGQKKVAVFNGPKNLLAEMENGIDLDITNNIFCAVIADGFTYFGCEGGIIIKAYVDYSGSTASPEVNLLKTLSAKEALRQAKLYTDEQVAALTERVTALEALNQTV